MSFQHVKKCLNGSPMWTTEDSVLGELKLVGEGLQEACLVDALLGEVAVHELVIDYGL